MQARGIKGPGLSNCCELASEIEKSGLRSCEHRRNSVRSRSAEEDGGEVKKPFKLRAP